MGGKGSAFPRPDAADAARLPEAAEPDGGRVWLPLNALRAFEAVGGRLSFTGAAAALHISQSALSRHVGRLEEYLGCRLLDRRAQGMALTAAGAALLPVVADSFDRIEETMKMLRRDPGHAGRVLKIHMPPTFLHVAGLTLLAEFRRAFPGLPIDVSSSNGIGLPAGRSVDLAVVFDRPHLGDAIRDPLWMVSQTPACTPEIAARAEGLDLAEFLRSTELLHVKLEGEPYSTFWSVYARHNGLDIGVQRGLAFESEVLAVQCAVAGGGVTLVDPDMFAADIAGGRLVTPFPDTTCASGFGYYLTVHPDDMVDPAVALFRSWVVRRYTQAPSDDPV
ncbi:DNA-binding transcriptional LysR family regulator [Angulomicrobium tetraedrale]|uniref:DNA-binding transcriptional LysR family regulator n=1 Tax=Ancylobacter tetraedralis TaxID=217068 RepID=A0A839Z898_9HYPH|nr:LysR substrate-binding domain-containing protein [Ancylobacter tetraedralis]MBB3769577.1 DNA-binding transcriptional LysR family regulator [Ancylobacter tetraedralis]